jgi:hypothetical protein
MTEIIHETKVITKENNFEIHGLCAQNRLRNQDATLKNKECGIHELLY